MMKRRSGSLTRWQPSNGSGKQSAKAMPVILVRPEEWRAWLTAPVEQALHLQRPLPDGELDILVEDVGDDPA